MRRFLLLAALGLTILPLAGQAEPASKRPTLGDLAELLPASTLAYVELKHPPLIRELRQLFHGSGFDDYAAFREEHKPKSKRSDRFFISNLNGPLFAFIFTPEFLDELERFNQHGVALLGFTRTGEPRSVWIMDSGDSNIPNLITRDILTLVSRFHIVARVEGVRLYQYRSSDILHPTIKGKEEAVKPQPDYEGPVIALMPKVVLVGSDVASVRDVILRMKKKHAEPSLASSKAFRQARELRSKPGMFGYAELGKIFGPKGPLAKNGKAPWAFDTFFGAERIFLQSAILFNPQTLRTGAAHLGVEKGEIELQLRFQVEPDMTSPLSTLLGQRLASQDLLHYVPKNAVVALTLPLADKPASWEKVLQQIDQIARSYGLEKQLSSKYIAEWCKEMELDPAKDLLGKVRSLTPGIIELDWRKPEGVLILEGVNAGAAKELETLANKIRKRVTESIKFEVGRQDKLVVVGTSAKAVQNALEDGRRRQGFASRPEVARTLKDLTRARVVGCWSVQGLLQMGLAAEQRSVASQLEQSRKKVKPTNEALVRLDELRNKQLEEYQLWLTKTAPTLIRVADKLPAGEVSLTTGTDQVTFRLRQRGLRGVAPKLVDTLLLWELNAPEPLVVIGFESVSPPPPNKENKDKYSINIFY
jgi:hypothetical protein